MQSRPQTDLIDMGIYPHWPPHSRIALAQKIVRKSQANRTDLKQRLQQWPLN
jgi:hypothetical protein